MGVPIGLPSYFLLDIQGTSGRKAPSPCKTTEQYIRGWTIGRMNRPSWNRMEACHEVLDWPSGRAVTAWETVV
jgi:hypothetical protein